MDPRRILLSAFTTAMLIATIAAPTLAAAPTFSGLLTCLDAVGDVRELNTVAGATKQEIGGWKKFWGQSGSCAKGSFDASGLTQDP